MKIKHIVYTLLILGLSALIIYRINQNKQLSASGPRSGNSVTTVSGMVIKPQRFEDVISLSGSLEANEQVDLRSEISGIVENIHFKEGQQVVKGQVLFQVNDLELRARLAQTQSAENLASENERRAKLLLEQQAISQEEYDISNADLQSTRAQSQLTAAQLSKTTVRAPFSGTIGLRSISPGTYVTPATPIAKLVNTSQLKITFSVPEKYAANMKIGNVVTFTTANLPEHHSAEIYAIEPEIELATRTLKMRALAQNEEGKLYPGTFANVQLPLMVVDDAIMVPTEALIPIQNGKVIYIAQEGRAKEVVVQTGSRTDRMVQVLSGLKPGDTILTYGVMAIKNGAPVKVNLEEYPVNTAAK